MAYRYCKKGVGSYLTQRISTVIIPSIVGIVVILIKKKIRKYAIAITSITIVLIICVFMWIKTDESSTTTETATGKGESHVTETENSAQKQPIKEIKESKNKDIIKHLNLNEEITDIFNGYTKNYTFSVPVSGSICLKWQAGERTSSKILYNVSLHSENINKDKIISYAMQSTSDYITCDPIFLSSGDYALSVEAVKNNKTDPYSLLIQFEPEEYIELENNNNFSSATQVELDKSYSSSLHLKKDEDYYSFRLSKACAVNTSINFTGNNQDAMFYYLTVYDASRTILTDTEVNGKTSFAETGNLYLKAGSYYIRIKHGNIWNAGRYNLTVNTYNKKFIETEKNDTINTADTIPVNEDIYASTGTEEDIDYFKFILDKASIITPQFDFTPFTSDFKNLKMYTLTVCDNKGKEIAEFNFKGDNKPSGAIKPLKLKSGTYIIKVERIKRNEKPFRLRKYILRLF